ncbi:MAG: hypothetical protein RIG82_08585 [Phycisphaeraceae bacterium]
MNNPSKWTCLLATSMAISGCNSHNYDFVAAPNDPSRVSHLVNDLNQLRNAEPQADEELYDISLVPLVHSHLHVFSPVDEDDTPTAFVEADIAACLPLFAFVNGTVSRYDEKQQLLTRHDFNSNLWGAFRNERELVATRSGDRETTSHTFLWLFTWRGQEQWHPADQKTLEPS